MTQASDLMTLVSLVAAAFVGGLLGASVVLFLFQSRLNRLLAELMEELTDLFRRLESSLAVLSQARQPRAAEAFPGEGRKGPATGIHLQADRSRSAGDDAVVTGPSGATVAEAAPAASGPAQVQTRGGAGTPMSQWLEIYSRDPESFRQEASPRAVTVRKTGPGPSTASAISEHPNGRFWLFTAEGRDWVVPKAGLRIDETSFYDTGIRDLFDCPGYESHRAYAFSVVRAAGVSRSGDFWTLAERGRLELRPEADA